MAAPKVTYKENDVSSSVSLATDVYIGMVVDLKRGKTNTPFLATSKTKFLSTTTPNSKVEVGYSTGYFSVLSSLQKTGNIWLVRPETEDMKYSAATVSEGAIASVVAGVADPEAFVFASESFLLAADSQGEWGDRVYVTIHSYKAREAVSITDSSMTVTQKWGKGFPVKFYGTVPPELNNTSTYFVVPDGNGKIKLAATQANALAQVPVTLTITDTASGEHPYLVPAIEYTTIEDTMLISVYTSSNLVTPVEKFVVSKTNGAKDGYGNALYLETVLSASEYLQAIDNVLVSDPMVGDIVVPTQLKGGDDGSAATDGDFITALNTLSSPGDYKVTLLLDGGRTTTAYQSQLIALAEARTDCVAILSTPYDAQTNKNTAVAQMINYRKYTANFDSSYAAMYGPHLKVYDEFNDRDIWVAPDGAAAGAIVDTASNYELWYPVGGNTRGVLNVLDTKVHFEDTDMDQLYDAGINPIRYKAGNGIKIWGQKTLQYKQSMLDRLNVRLLLVTIGPAIVEYLEDFLFEFNDDTTRALAKAKIDAYMTNIQARRGVTLFETICDLTNNSETDIANHIMNVDLVICPNTSVESIPFKITITDSATTFNLVTASL